MKLIYHFYLLNYYYNLLINKFKSINFLYLEAGALSNLI